MWGVWVHGAAHKEFVCEVVDENYIPYSKFPIVTHVYDALPGQNCLNKGSVLYALLLKLDLVFRLWKVKEQKH